MNTVVSGSIFFFNSYNSKLYRAHTNGAVKLQTLTKQLAPTGLTPITLHATQRKYQNNHHFAW